MWLIYLLSHVLAAPLAERRARRLKLPGPCEYERVGGLTVDGDEVTVVGLIDELVVQCVLQITPSGAPAFVSAEVLALSPPAKGMAWAASGEGFTLAAVYGAFPPRYAGDLVLMGDSWQTVEWSGGAGEVVPLCSALRTDFCAFLQSTAVFDRGPGGVVVSGSAWERVASHYSRSAGDNQYEDVWGTFLGLRDAQGWHVADIPLDGGGPLALGATAEGELRVVWAGERGGEASLAVRRLIRGEGGALVSIGERALSLPSGSEKIAIAASSDAIASLSGCRLTSYTLTEEGLAPAAELTIPGRGPCSFVLSPQGLAARGAAFGVLDAGLDTVFVFELEGSELRELRALRLRDAGRHAAGHDWMWAFAADSAVCLFLGYDEPPELRCVPRISGLKAGPR